MMKNELEIINLNKQFKDVKALNNINYTFHNGIYGLLGPNGAGKSTLINAITDNIKRDSGSILWNGNEILRLGKKYRNELGYMQQQQGYYGEFTAYAFMMYLAGLKGLDKKEAKARTEELLNEVNMYEFRNKTLEKMSGGMKQRVLLAQSLLNNPSLLVLDEPTAGVDPQERVNIRNYIHSIAKDRIVLISTHIISDIEMIANEIIIMNHGKFLCTLDDEENVEDAYLKWIGDKKI